MLFKTTLAFPGTILNLKRGRIDLSLLGQQELLELHREGCPYVIPVLVGSPSPSASEAQGKPTLQAKGKRASARKTPSMSSGVASKNPLPAADSPPSS